jgi:hypothetical protein
VITSKKRIDGTSVDIRITCTERAQQTQKPFNKTKIDRFSHTSITKPAPEPARRYSRLVYLRAGVFALKNVVRYLKPVRKNSKRHIAAIPPGSKNIQAGSVNVGGPPG